MARYPTVAGAGGGPRRNLRVIVTLSTAVIAYIGCIHPSYGGDMASQSKASSSAQKVAAARMPATPKKSEAERAQERKDAINELSFMDVFTLDEQRNNCAEGGEWNVKRMQEARGNGYPQVHEICAAAEDVAARRKLTAHLFESIAVRELGIGNQADSERTQQAVDSGVASPVKLANIILNAAVKGNTSYIGLSGKEQALRPELAYAAGHWYGRANPEQIVALSAEAQEQGKRECYKEIPEKVITLDGHTLPATKACAIVGGNAGTRFAVSKNVPETLPKPVTPPSGIKPVSAGRSVKE
jgi:hypothetical protein